MRNKDVYLVNRILFTKVEETMPRYCPTPDSPRNSPLTSADAAKIASPIGVMLSILK